MTLDPNEPTDLRFAVGALWELLPAREVRVLQAGNPEVVELCQHLHEQDWHTT